MQRRTVVYVTTTTVVAAVALVFTACSDMSAPPANDTLAPSLAKSRSTRKVRSISVSPSSATVAAGKTVQLTATVTPSGSAVGVTWSSSNSAVATVSTSGLVTGVAAGTATVSAAAGGKTGTAAVTVSATAPPPAPEVLIGAGDIAICGSTDDDATANLLVATSGTVFTLGDNAYPDGSAANYTNCYNGSWGRVKARTKPAPGNHEYHTAGAAGYFGYFGSAAGAAGKGYYSYDLGAWHVVVLNSNSACTTISCAATSAQVQWLKADLAASTKACTLAYWHHPRFNSGAEHGNLAAVGPFWDALYAAGAEVVLNGHEHVYERFAPQTPQAVAAANGIRQFTVGTGGAEHYAFSSTIQPNSERRNNTSFGVLKLTLKAGGYDWQFIPAAGSSFTDSGSGTCH